jgi:hypothetical protein
MVTERCSAASRKERRPRRTDEETIGIFDIGTAPLAQHSRKSRQFSGAHEGAHDIDIARIQGDQCDPGRAIHKWAFSRTRAASA